MIIDKLLTLNIRFVESFGYVLCFLATFLESSPFIGLFIPGSIVVVFGGFLAKFGFLNLWLVMGFSMCGAILGDLSGYLVGRYFGKEFLHKYGGYVLVRKEYIEKSCEIVKGHPGKSLVFGRLNPLTRAAAPFVVGANKTKFGKFMFFNIIGGILWGFFFTSVGYILGESYQVAETFERWIILATVLLIVGVYLYYFFRGLSKKKNSENCINK